MSEAHFQYIKTKDYLKVGDNVIAKFLLFT